MNAVLEINFTMFLKLPTIDPGFIRSYFIPVFNKLILPPHFFFFSIPKTEPRALSMLPKHSIVEIDVQPSGFVKD